MSLFVPRPPGPAYHARAGDADRLLSGDRERAGSRHARAGTCWPSDPTV